MEKKFEKVDEGIEGRESVTEVWKEVWREVRLNAILLIVRHIIFPLIPKNKNGGVEREMEIILTVEVLICWILKGISNSSKRKEKLKEL